MKVGKKGKKSTKPRKELSADKLFKYVRQELGKIEDHRPKNVEIELGDALMSGFAMFALKDPSLLAFDERRAKPENMERIFGIGRMPCDTQMRTIADNVEPEKLRPLFKGIVSKLQRGKVLEKMVFMEKYYLASLDGTGYFSSKKVHCESCLQRVNKKTGEVTYSHQMLGAAIVHPDQKAVIPLMPEAIVKQDGEKKNDCERNAAKRLLAKLREDYPRLALVIIEDSLSSNAPHIKEIERHNFHYILGVKPGDHTYLFSRVEAAHAAGKTTEFEVVKEGVTHRFRYVNHMPINESNQDVRVNFLEYWETKNGKTRHFTWVTDFVIDTHNAYDLMRGGRARWKIENETFNTLKNQGYHFEHNFGHGENQLSVVFAQLMLLAFAIDQAQQLACRLFQAAWKKAKSKRFLWERMRSLFYELPLVSMSMIWQAIAYGFHIEGTVVIHADP
jgi:hypothetical protein